MDHNLTAEQLDRIIEMAWEDRTPFEAISLQFGISEMETKIIMRKELKRSSYELWRKRVTNRKTKHEKLRSFSEGRFKCKLQRQITNNKISKR